MRMFKSKCFYSILLGIFIISLFFSCSGGKGTSQQGTIKRPIVGASLLTQTHVFYQDLAGAMKETAEQKNIQMKIQYAEFDPRKQNDQIEMFILQRVSSSPDRFQRNGSDY